MYRLLTKLPNVFDEYVLALVTRCSAVVQLLSGEGKQIHVLVCTEIFNEIST